MLLGHKQELLARLLPLLITRAYELGFTVRLKELQRAPEQAEFNATHCGRCRVAERDHEEAAHKFHPIGLRDSLHCDGLAIDLVLFKDDEPLWDSKHYRDLGEYWENLHELCRAGFRFNDGGHFSLTHGNRR